MVGVEEPSSGSPLVGAEPSLLGTGHPAGPLPVGAGKRAVLRALHPYYTKSRLRTGLLGQKSAFVFQILRGQNHPFGLDWSARRTARCDLPVGESRRADASRICPILCGLWPWPIPPLRGAAAEHRSLAAHKGRRSRTRSGRPCLRLAPDVGHNPAPHPVGTTPFSSVYFTQPRRANVTKIAVAR